MAEECYFDAGLDLVFQPGSTSLQGHITLLILSDGKSETVLSFLDFKHGMI